MFKTSWSNAPSLSRDVIDLFANSSTNPAGLRSAFERYGHVVPTEIILGGAIIALVSIGEWTSVLEGDQEAALRIAFEDKLGLRALDGNRGITSISLVWHIRNSMKITVLGGNTCPINSQGSLERWLDSIEDPSKWEIIRVSSFIPLPDLLKGDHPTIYRQITATVRSLFDKEGFFRHISGGVFLKRRYELGPDIIKPDYEIPLASFPGTLTIAAWVMARDISTDSIALSISSHESTNVEYSVCIGVDNGRFYVKHRGDVHYADIASQVELLAKQSWVHVALVNGSSYLQPFINGNPIQTAASYSTNLNIVNPKIFVGYGFDANRAKCKRWNGMIERVHFCQKALTQSDIQVMTRWAPL